MIYSGRSLRTNRCRPGWVLRMPSDYPVRSIATAVRDALPTQSHKHGLLGLKHRKRHYCERRQGEGGALESGLKPG